MLMRQIGYTILRALIQSTAADARDAVREVIGVPFGELTLDWTAMLAVEDRADLGGPPRGTLTLPNYRLRDVYWLQSMHAGGTGVGDPLERIPLSLSAKSIQAAGVFNSAGSLFRLSTPPGAGGTGVGLAAPNRDDLLTGMAPRLLIIRTR